MGRGGPTDGDVCAECGGPLGDDPVALAAAYVDDAADEVDADLGFCTPEHRDAWVARTRPSATSAYEDGDAPWRTGPSSSDGTWKVVALVAAVLVVLVLAAWGIGRLLA